jgi:internalin A
MGDGVLFEQDNTSVLAEVLPTGDEIELCARGPENKALLSVISADLDALNDSFKGGLRDKVDKRIPCNCTACRTAASPHFYEYKELLMRKKLGKKTIECKCPNYEEVDVLQLLDGISVEHPPVWAMNASRTEQVRVLRIFLASSSELRLDRDDFELYFRQQNDRLRDDGIYLEIVRWENFLGAMSDSRLQDEYNKEVCNCDVFVSLFFTKAGMFAREELEVAWKQFKQLGRPLIYTYFKNADVNIGNIQPHDFLSRFRFKETLENLGHFPTSYTSHEDLKLHFRDQLPMIREKLGI